MKTNSQFALTSLLDAGAAVDEREPLEVVGRRRRATISVCSRTSMLSAALIRSTRYCDIDFSSASPRTSSTTRAGEAGEVERRLPGGVGRADDVDVVALGGSCVARRRAVEHAPPGQLGEPRRLEQAIRHAGGDHHGPGLDLGAVVEAHRVHRAALLERRRRCGRAPSRRRAGGPASSPGARGRRRSARSGSRGSSRCARSGRPARRAHRVRSPRCAGPPTRRTPPPPGRPGRRR